MPVLAPVTTAAVGVGAGGGWGWEVGVVARVARAAGGVGAGGGWGMDFPVRCQSIAARAFAPGQPAALARAGGAVLGAAAIAADIAAAATAFARDRLRAIRLASLLA